jgi:hypothetical protein
MNKAGNATHICAETVPYRLPDVDLSKIAEEQKRRMARELPTVIPTSRRTYWPATMPRGRS